MLEPRLLSICSVAVRDINTNHCHEDFQNLVGVNEHTQLARERLMAGRATDRNSKIDPRFEVLMIAQSANSADADVVSIFDGSNQTAAIKGDVKLPRQVVKLTVVDNELPELVAEEGYINEFVSIDASRRTSCQVADIVRPCAARVQTHALDALEDVRGVAWLD